MQLLWMLIVLHDSFDVVFAVAQHNHHYRVVDGGLQNLGLSRHLLFPYNLACIIRQADARLSALALRHYVFLWETALKLWGRDKSVRYRR